MAADEKILLIWLCEPWILPVVHVNNRVFAYRDNETEGVVCNHFQLDTIAVDDIGAWKSRRIFLYLPRI